MKKQTSKVNYSGKEFDRECIKRCKEWLAQAELKMPKSTIVDFLGGQFEMAFVPHEKGACYHETEVVMQFDAFKEWVLDMLSASAIKPKAKSKRKAKRSAKR